MYLSRCQRSNTPPGPKKLYTIISFTRMQLKMNIQSVYSHINTCTLRSNCHLLSSRPSKTKNIKCIRTFSREKQNLSFDKLAPVRAIKHVTCLSPTAQLDVGVLREVWDAVGYHEASPVESWRGEISWLRWIKKCRLFFSEEALHDCFINTETVHGPVGEKVRPQGQIRHQALW